MEIPNRAGRGSEIPYRLLLDMSQRISGTIDLQETLAHLLRSLREAVDYDAAGIFVLNRNVPFGGGLATNMIAGMAAVGFDITERTDPMLRSGKGIVGHVIQTGETVVARDVSCDPYYVEGRPSTKSELAVPIVSNGVVMGALNLESDALDSFSPDDAEMVEAFAVAAAISIEKAILHKEVMDKRLLEHQLRIARDVQATLLPTRAPAFAGYDIDGLNVPAWDIGGDYFDYLMLPDGRLGLVIADVSGKGVPAALLMATFRAALRSEVRKNRPIPEIIQDVHATLVDSIDLSRFVSTVFGTLEPASGAFSYLNCGHNAPLLLHARGGCDVLTANRPALGMFGGKAVAPATATLHSGDTLLLYTDGVVEIADAGGTEFGEERLESVLRAAASRPAEAVIAAIVDATRTFSGRERYDDDFTLLVVKRTE